MFKTQTVWLALLLASPSFPGLAQSVPEASPRELLNFSHEFHAWLDANRPVTPFAVLRNTRPPGWAPDWSEGALHQRKLDYLRFQSRLKALESPEFEVGDQIDAAILKATIDGVHWDLEVLARHRRDPGFYLDQTLGSIFEVLIRTPEPTEADVAEVIRRLHRFTPIINEAKSGLDQTVPELADAAIARIGDADVRVDALKAGLDPFVSDRLRYDFNVGLRAARQSLTTFKDWLEVSFPRFEEPPAVGAQRYRWFLGHVASVPRTADALLTESELAMARVGAQIAVIRHRLAEQPDPAPLANLDRLLQMSQINQQELLTYLGSVNLVSLPADLPPFNLSDLPPGLVPLTDSGELIQFSGGPDNGTVRYMPPVADALGYLERLAWLDPRLLISWDGIPGRHIQRWSASRHPRAVRHLATGASLYTGLALYFHQQTTESGLYAFKPASQILALQILQHHAALAQADIRLGRGDWNVDEAARFLVERGELTQQQSLAAVHRSIAFPGQAAAAFAAYGQVLRFLADAAAALGADFSLPDFNDRLLMNANVPVALQRWELLGLEEELDQLVEQRGRPVTVPQ